MSDNTDKSWVAKALRPTDDPRDKDLSDSHPTKRVHYFADATWATDGIELRAIPAENGTPNFKGVAGQLADAPEYYEQAFDARRLAAILEGAERVVVRMRTDTQAPCELFLFAADDAQSYAVLMPLALRGNLARGRWRPQALEDDIVAMSPNETDTADDEPAISEQERWEAEVRRLADKEVPNWETFRIDRDGRGFAYEKEPEIKGDKWWGEGIFIDIKPPPFIYAWTTYELENDTDESDTAVYNDYLTLSEFAQWLKDCCEVVGLHESADVFESLGALYKSYKSWCCKNSTEPKGAHELRRLLEYEGFLFNKRRINDIITTVIERVKLKKDTAEPDTYQWSEQLDSCERGVK